jgi:hypothetical protein
MLALLWRALQRAVVNFSSPFLILILFLSGCGYVGPVVPPSPELPNAVTDLTVIEKGDQIGITFTAPLRTTDNLAIKQFSVIDLRIGPAVTPFDYDRWAASAKQYQLQIPPPNDPDAPKPVPISKSLPASEWQGQRIAVAVRTAVKRTGHYSQWSNRGVLEVIPPIQAPVLQVKATKDGYLLTWQNAGDGFKYKIFRQAPNEKTPAQIGTADSPLYVDSTSQWDLPYTYIVVAQKDAAESLPSKPEQIVSADTFAPAIPASIIALAGPDSIQLSWSRSPDADLKGYYVYRSVNGGSWERQGDLINVPAFSDRNVEHGKNYRYAVTAIDQKNNESDKSTVAEVTF